MDYCYIYETLLIPNEIKPILNNNTLFVCVHKYLGGSCYIVAYWKGTKRISTNTGPISVLSE